MGGGERAGGGETEWVAERSRREEGLDLRRRREGFRAGERIDRSGPAEIREAFVVGPAIFVEAGFRWQMAEAATENFWGSRRILGRAGFQAAEPPQDFPQRRAAALERREEHGTLAANFHPGLHELVRDFLRSAEGGQQMGGLGEEILKLLKTRRGAEQDSFERRGELPEQREHKGGC